MTPKSAETSGSSPQAGCFEKVERAVAEVHRLAGTGKVKEKAFAEVLETPADSDLTLLLSLAELRPSAAPEAVQGAKRPSSNPPSSQEDGGGAADRDRTDEAAVPVPAAAAPKSAMPSLKRLGLIILSAEAVAACGIVVLWGPWLLSESIAHGLTHRGAAQHQPAAAPAKVSVAPALPRPPPPTSPKSPLSALEESLEAARLASPLPAAKVASELQRIVVASMATEAPPPPSEPSPSIEVSPTALPATELPAAPDVRQAVVPLPEPVEAALPDDPIVVELPPEVALASEDLQVDEPADRPALETLHAALAGEVRDVQLPIIATLPTLPDLPAAPIPVEPQRDLKAQREAEIAQALASERQLALHQERQRADHLARELASAREEIGTLRSRPATSWAAAPPLPIVPADPPSGHRPTPEQVSPMIEQDPTATAALVAPASTKPQERPALPEAPPPIPPERRLLERAEGLLKDRDISGARLLLERAVQMGSARGAFLLAQTYDPAMLAQWQVRGIAGDMAKAQELYAKARLPAPLEATGRPSVR